MNNFMIPVPGKITSPFGLRKHPITGRDSFHNGIDIACKVGTPVVAPDYGMVTEVWSHEQGGLCLAIENLDGVRFGFAHLSKRLVKKDQPVLKGQVIALSGNTGRSTGPHLHFTVKKLGVWVDPTLDFYNGVVSSE